MLLKFSISRSKGVKEKMKINERARVEYIQVVLEKGVDFEDCDMEDEYQTSLGHRRFKQDFISWLADATNYDEVVEIGLCSKHQTLVNATLIKYL